MSEAVFKLGYADQCDLYYGDKDYKSERDLLEQAFKRYSKKPVHSILDLGCGTGNHSIRISRRGIKGSEPSKPEVWLLLQPLYSKYSYWYQKLGDVQKRARKQNKTPQVEPDKLLKPEPDNVIQSEPYKTQPALKIKN